MTAGSPLIDEELTRFLRGPVSMMLGTADALSVPDVTRVTGVAALDGRRLRVLISPTARTAQANAVVGVRVAVLATNILTYRSLQWKGRVLSAGEGRTPGDLALLHRARETFYLAVPQVGFSAELAARLFPLDVVPLVVEVDSLYDQSPGPGAGRRIAVGAT